MAEVIHTIKERSEATGLASTLCKLSGHRSTESPNKYAKVQGGHFYAVLATDPLQAATCKTCRSIANATRNHSLAHMRKRKW